MALKTYRIPGLLGLDEGRISFHYREAKIVPRLLEIAAEGVRSHPGTPGDVLEFKDVFVLPGAETMALYAADGRRIDESCVRRGVGLDDVQLARDWIEPPREFKRIAGPLLYLSVYFNHWGHFLTESLSRMWARYAYPEFGEMTAFFGAFSRANKDNATTLQFLTSFGRAPLTLAKSFGPVLIETCFVPMPSFANRAYAFPAHRDALCDVAETTLRRAPAPSDGRPVYLSRTRLTQFNRVIANEQRLETALAARGFRIVYPETMTLDEQIAMVNAHRVFVGCVGSAFHSTLLCLDGGAITTHILSEKFPNVNCLLIDSIVGNESHYVHTCHKEPDDPARLTVDVETTLAYLDAAGLLT